MTVVRDSGNAARTIAAVSMRDANGIARSISAIMIRDANGLRSCLSTAPAVSVSPTSVDGTGYSKATINVTTDSATVTAPQGSTFAWSFDEAGWTASVPTGATSSFSHRAEPGNSYATNAICTVTLNGKVSTVSVYATVSNAYQVGG